MTSHILALLTTTKFFANALVFKKAIEEEGLPRDSPAGLGTRPTTPISLSIFTNYKRFQQLGESAFRSKVTRIG
jgi:hypothetical protein